MRHLADTLGLPFAVDYVPYLRAAAYFIATLIVAKIVDWLLDRYDHGLTKVLRRELSAAELSRLRVARRLIVAAVLFVGVGLSLWQIPGVGTFARAMLASAGIAALVVGLAARSVLANFISGLILAFSQPLRIGDYVCVDNDAGTVEEIRLTYTHIRTGDNRRVLIPNDLLTTKVIHNYSIVDEVSAATVEFAVPTDAPIAAVCAAVLAVAHDLEDHALGRPSSLEVADVSVEAVRLKLTLWAASRPAAADLAATARRRIAEDLQAAGYLHGAPEA
jgi:small-conductance mechanosensitive channel